MTSHERIAASKFTWDPTSRHPRMRKKFLDLEGGMSFVVGKIERDPVTGIATSIEIREDCYYGCAIQIYGHQGLTHFLRNNFDTRELEPNRLYMINEMSVEFVAAADYWEPDREVWKFKTHTIPVFWHRVFSGISWLVNRATKKSMLP